MIYIKINDGKGLFDNEGLCETLIADLNNLPKLLFNGQFIMFCQKISEMGLKLTNLHKGIFEDRKSMKDQIEELKKINDELLKQLSEKDGVTNGTD